MNHYLYYLIFSPIIFWLNASFLSFKKKYFWYEYFALFALPLIVLYFMSLATGYEIILVFVISCLVGPVIEISGGYAIKHFTGKHLWLYESHPIFNRMTSLTAVPFWGLAGTVFYSVDRLIIFFFG